MSKKTIWIAAIIVFITLIVGLSLVIYYFYDNGSSGECCFSNSNFPEVEEKKEQLIFLNPKHLLISAENFKKGFLPISHIVVDEPSSLTHEIYEILASQQSHKKEFLNVLWYSNYYDSCNVSYYAMKTLGGFYVSPELRLSESLYQKILKIQTLTLFKDANDKITDKLFASPRNNPFWDFAEEYDSIDEAYNAYDKKKDINILYL